MNRAAFSVPAMLLRTSSTASASSAVRRPRPRVLILTGPTAVGKSATALQICEALDGEIISADSVQVYRGMNIGSNKASYAERAIVPHHMLDIASPAEQEYTAGDFFRAARLATEDVLSRGKVPIVVGGTMMYVRWYMHGRPATPRPDENAKERVSAMVKDVKGDWDKGLALLAEKDPKRASVLSENDWYRLTRALEVVESTGMAMSDMPLQGGAPGAQKDKQLDYDFRCVFLYQDRIALNRRIDERCEEMILPRKASESEEEIESIIVEVADLLRTGGLRVSAASPARAIGYRQTVHYLVLRALAALEVPDETDDATEAFREYVEHFQTATRGYAKQQMAWFRKEPQFRWVKAGDAAVQSVQKLLTLSDDEYDVLRDLDETEQQEIREEIIAQGKGMKTYIARKVWLEKDSDAERRAVDIAELCARRVAMAIDRGELERIKGFVEK